MSVHPTAFVDEHASIADDVTIGPHCVVGPDVTLGKSTHLLGHVHIQGITTIGENNTIYPFVTLGLPPQDPKFKGEKTKTVIGDHNVFRESVTINAGSKGGGSVTRVGSHNLLMAYAHIGHDCQVGSHNSFVNHVSLAGHVTCGDHVTLSGYVGVTQFVRLGSFTMIGAGCIVSLDVPPFLLGKAKDNNRVAIQALNKIGLKRQGFSSERLELLDRAFRLVYKKNLTLEEAFEQSQQEGLDSEEVTTFFDFVRSSEKGIAR